MVSEHTETLAYLAGVIDSDGCINIQKRKAGKWAANYQPRVMVKQVTPHAPELLHRTFGGSLWVHAPSAARGRPLHTWNIHSAAAGEALRALLPYLRIKPEQAKNAIALCAITARLGLRKFPVPEVVDGEPLVSAVEAAARLGKSYEVVTQAIRQGTVPFVRGPRSGSKPSLFIPESFLPIWANRGSSPTRDSAITVEMEAIYQRGKHLNRVGA